MSDLFGPSIITDGLILYLDSDNERSYSGNGNLWKDISGYGNNITSLNIGNYSEQDAFNQAPINIGIDQTFRLIPLSRYSSGETQNISFKLYIEGGGNVWGDFFSVTLPVGFIINSGSLTLGTDSNIELSPAGLAEPINGIINNSRTISWGDDDNIWGGIPNYLGGVWNGPDGQEDSTIFTLNLTIDQNITGNQILDISISFDTSPTTIFNGYTILYEESNLLKFNGINDYALGIYNLNTVINNFTIETWFKSESFSTTQTIMSKNTDWSLRITNSTTIVLYNNTLNVTAVVPNMIINQWYKLTITSISGVIRIYLNGVLYKTESMIVTNNSQSSYTLGCSNTQNLFFKGEISTIRMYNRGLSDSEVLQNFNVIKNRFLGY
jgi:hypothetical protein